MMRLLITIFFLHLGAIQVHSQEVLPNQQWLQAESQNFKVVFNAKQQELAWLYLNKLEKAHTFLISYFPQMPISKTLVILNDKTDLTNGYATRIPYPHIMIYPVLPTSQDSLADYDDWILELVTHEYTHILTFNSISGWMKPLQSVFGNIVSPNLLLPTWWKEGVAVNMESLVAKGGRMRSSYQDSMLRAFYSEKSLISQFPISEVNDPFPVWPEGQRPYLFGSLLWSEILQQPSSANLVKELHTQHGKRIPYFIEGPAKNLLGSSYPMFYKSALIALETKLKQQIEALEKTKFSEGKTPEVIAGTQWRYSLAPTLHAQEKYLAYIAVDSSRQRHIRIVQADKTKSIETTPETISEEHYEAPPTGSIQRLSWFHKDSRLIYDKVDFINRVERYSDLYTYDMKSNKTERLTRGQRAREPAVSLDDESIVYVQLTGGRTRLVEFNLKTKVAQILLEPRWQERISYPIYWDQEHIIFSWKRGSQENLFLLNRNNLQTKLILPEFSNARFAVKTHQGLIFSSTKNGVPNIYLSVDLLTAKPQTHVKTGAYTAAWDGSSELIATIMTSQGPQLQWLPINQEMQELPAVAPLWTEPPVKNNLLAINDKAEYTAKPYSSLPYLWPQYWIPFFATSSSDGGLFLQARTSGFDPLKRHNYSLIGEYNSNKNKFDFQGQYLNQTTSLPWTLMISNETDSILGSQQWVETENIQMSALPDTWDFNRYTKATIGWEWQEKKLFQEVLHKTGPLIQWSFNNTSLSGEDLVPNSGYRLFFQYNSYIENKNYLQHTQYLSKVQMYWSKWLPHQNVLNLSFEGFYIPENINFFLGATNTSFVGSNSSLSPQFLTRGYRSQQFWGKELAAAHFEYTFPLKSIYKGSGTDPYFLKRLYGSLVADGIALRGIYYDEKLYRYLPTDWSRSFWSAGIQAHLDMTVGYVLPLQLVLGYYSSQDAGSQNNSISTALVLGTL